MNLPFEVRFVVDVPSETPDPLMEEAVRRARLLTSAYVTDPRDESGREFTVEVPSGDSRDWARNLTEVTITVQDVANRLHRKLYGADSEHLSIHSCPCDLFARWYLGLSEYPDLYWPGGGDKPAETAVEIAPFPEYYWNEEYKCWEETCRVTGDALKWLRRGVDTARKQAVGITGEG